MLTIKSGNLVDATEQMLVHQANCFNTMGTGVALALRTRWPKIYIADCETIKGDKSKLGSFSKTWVNQKQIVINMYGQYAYGRDKQYTDYEAVTKAFNAICELAVKLKITTIAIPYKMGCNNAGGDWNVISTIIENAAKKHNLSVVAYQY